MRISTGTLRGCCKSAADPYESYDWLIQRYRDNDINGLGLELTFSTEDDRFGETITIDLKPNGREVEVTNENKREYVEYVCRCLLLVM